MFRDMMAKRQATSRERAEEMIANTNYGVLAIDSVEGYPYSVPVNIMWKDGKIFFHGMNKGLKNESIKANPKASICVIEYQKIDPPDYSTKFKSVICFGTIRVLEDPEEIRQRTIELGEYFYPGHMERVTDVTERNMPALAVYEFNIDHISGKESMVVVQEREAKEAAEK